MIKFAAYRYAKQEKIRGRIRGAFMGYEDFHRAWAEIEQIAVDPALSLREFCQRYATDLLNIFAKYFAEKPEEQFEGNARGLVEAQCNKIWERFLRQKAYHLEVADTTAHHSHHAFDCYVELTHNGGLAARCFGEAKNYELLKSHFDTFKQWLKDANFKGNDSDPPELAFIIAPDCPPLLQRKLELANIRFLQAPKIQTSVRTKVAGSSSSSINMSATTLCQESCRGLGVLYGVCCERVIR